MIVSPKNTVFADLWLLRLKYSNLYAKIYQVFLRKVWPEAKVDHVENERMFISSCHFLTAKLLCWPVLVLKSVCPDFRKSMPEGQKKSPGIQFLLWCEFHLGWVCTKTTGTVLRLCLIPNLFGDWMSQCKYRHMKEVLCDLIIWHIVTWTMQGARSWPGCCHACMQENQ